MTEAQRALIALIETHIKNQKKPKTQIASQVGISRSALYNLLRGDSLPQEEIINGLIRVLNIGSDDKQRIRRLLDEIQDGAVSTRDRDVRKFLTQQASALLAGAYSLPMGRTGHREPYVEAQLEKVATEQGPVSSSVEGLFPVLSRQRHAIIEGVAGSGKTSALRHIMIAYTEVLTGASTQSATEAKRLADSGQARIPLWLSARDIAGRGLLTERILAGLQANLKTQSPPLKQGFWKSPALDARWLLLVDGLDEIVDSQDRTDLIKDLAVLADGQTVDLDIVITTRPAAGSDLQDLCKAGFAHYRISRFAPDDTRKLAKAFLADTPLLDGFLADILQPANAWIAQSPLYLRCTLGMIVAEDESAVFPTSKVHLLARFLGLCIGERHDNHEVEEKLTTTITNAGVTFNVARTLVELRQTLLLETARALVLFGQDPLQAAVDQAKALLSADALTFVRDPDSLIITVLKSTGLVTEHAGTLQWAHRVLAEFMVGQAYANDLDKALRIEGTHRQRPWPPSDLESDRLIGWALRYLHTDVFVMAIVTFIERHGGDFEPLLHVLLARSDSNDMAPHHYGHSLVTVNGDSSQPDYPAVLAGRLVAFGARASAPTYNALVERLCQRSGTIHNADLYTDVILALPDRTTVPGHLASLLADPKTAYGVALRVAVRTMASIDTVEATVQLALDALDAASPRERTVTTWPGRSSTCDQNSAVITAQALTFLGPDAHEHVNRLLAPFDQDQLEDPDRLDDLDRVIIADACRAMGDPEGSIRHLRLCENPYAGVVVDRFLLAERTDLALASAQAVVQYMWLEGAVREITALCGRLPSADFAGLTRHLLGRVIAEQDELDADSPHVIRVGSGPSTEAAHVTAQILALIVQGAGPGAAAFVSSTILEPRPPGAAGATWDILHRDEETLGRALDPVRHLAAADDPEAAVACLWYLVENVPLEDYAHIESLNILVRLGERRAEERVTTLMRSSRVDTGSRLHLIKCHLNGKLDHVAYEALTDLTTSADGKDIVEVARLVRHDSNLINLAAQRMAHELRAGHIFWPPDFHDALRMLTDLAPPDESLGFFDECLSDRDLSVAARWGILQYLRHEDMLQATMKPAVRQILADLNNGTTFREGLEQFGDFLEHGETNMLVLQRILRGADSLTELLADADILPALLDRTEGHWPSDPRVLSLLRRLCSYDPVIEEDEFEQYRDPSRLTDDALAYGIRMADGWPDGAADAGESRSLVHHLNGHYELDLTAFAMALPEAGDATYARNCLLRWSADDRLSQALRDKAQELHARLER